MSLSRAPRPDLSERVAAHTWYHTIDLGQGVLTEGMFDHRGAVDRYLLPRDLSGMRCLDVGTMDGFWAFEMERRGASEVVAADLGRVDELDWPPRWKVSERELDVHKEERFRLVRDALGSQVQRVERSVYDLDGTLGAFDLVFCGDLLVHLKDPVGALQRLHDVCRGSTIVANPTKRFPLSRRRALAEFDGIAEFRWWLLSEAALERMMLAVGFEHVERSRPFEVPARGGGWRGRRCALRGEVGAQA